ncbi:MAG: anti-sigma factor [Hyphomicrobiales bacterium]|nr:MAG: anti-sigma factor [Hyphomicrobiales bacterium]
MSDESNIDGRDGDHLLAAEYALGVLPVGEHEGVRARIKAEPALRADLAFWRNRLASLDTEFAETPAPAGVWPRLEQRLFTGQTKPGFWNSLALWRSLTAAAAAVAVVAVSLNVLTPRPDANMFAAELVAALHEQGTNVSFVALYNPQTGQIRLTALSGDTMPDQDYELWAIEGSNAPVSMGVVPIDASMDMELPENVKADFGAGSVLAITIEQKGGSPTGAPQGPVVAKGMATQI